MAELKNFFAELQSPKRIVLIAHSRPDGDAIGSCLALKKYFMKKGHKADVIAPDDFPDFLRWMKQSEDIYIYQKKSKTCFAILTQADYIFCCDFNALKRIDELGNDILKMHKATLVMIDHHRNPEHFAKYELWNQYASSTCELIFEFILMAGDEHIIDSDIASNIYAGIAMDTGVFQYSNTSARVHEIAALLIGKGINIEYIHNQVYNQYGENRMRFLGYLLKDKMEILSDCGAAFITITMKEAEEYHLNTGDKEGIVNLPLAIKNILVSALFTEDKDKIKISFRSKGDIRVDIFADKFFNGGGHKNAAGGSSKQSLGETIEIYKNEIQKFLQSQTNS